MNHTRKYHNHYYELKDNRVIIELHPQIKRFYDKWGFNYIKAYNYRGTYNYYLSRQVSSRGTDPQGKPNPLTTPKGGFIGGHCDGQRPSREMDNLEAFF
jgi:hypothetical protein